MANDLMQQVVEYYGAVQSQMVNSPETLPTAAPGAPQLVNRTNKELPQVTLYHIVNWDENGLPCDWHEDHPRLDANGLMRRLAKTRGGNDKWAGRPVWLLRIPDGASKPQETVACSHPGCPWTGRTEEDRQVHYRYSHPQWFQMEEERRSRETKEQELTLMRQQVEELGKMLSLNQEVIGLLLAERQEGAKRGKS